MKVISGIVLTIILSILSYPSVSLSNPDLFYPHMRFPIGPSAEAIAISDINGDGKKDVVVAAPPVIGEPENTPHLFIFFQDNKGRFHIPIRYPGGNGKSLDIGDLNNDGRVDIVVTTEEGIGILYQNASGSFDPMITYACSSRDFVYSNIVRIGDFNNDGLPDIIYGITINKNDPPPDMPHLFFLFQKQDGTFEAPVTSQVWPTDIAMGDLNHDGLTDIAMIAVGEGLKVFLQSNGGAFNVLNYNSPGVWPLNLAIGDINNDGLQDVAITYSLEGESYGVAVYLQNNGGNLDLVMSFPISEYTGAIRLGDVNNDGRLDVLVLHNLGDSMSWRYVLGVNIQKEDGTFLPEELYWLTYGLANSWPDRFVMGDINGDGSNDVLVAGEDEGLVVSYNRGPGPRISCQSFINHGAITKGNVSSQSINVFNEGISDLNINSITITGANTPEFKIVADSCTGYIIPSLFGCSLKISFSPISNGLKKANLFISSNDSKNSVKTVQLNGEGVLGQVQVPQAQFQTYIELPVDYIFTEAVAIGDINGDGRDDVVVTSRDAAIYGVHIYLQNSNGELDPPINYPVGNGQSIDIGDLNNDGRRDIVFSLANGIGVFYQNTSGGLNPMVTYTSNRITSANSYKVRIGDFNNDGLLDVVSIYWGLQSRDVEVFLQNEEGTLDPPIVYKVAHYGYDDLHSGDINNDGLTDIVVMSGQSWMQNSIGALIQDTNGMFGSLTYYNPMPMYDGLLYYQSVQAIAIGDVNGDGLQDIVVAFNGKNPYVKIGIFFQNNSGDLDPMISLDTYDYPLAVVISDINNDGRQDIVVSHRMGGIGIYLQDSNGALLPEFRLYLPLNQNINPQGLAVGDINGDGLKDIIVSFQDYSLGALAVFYNTNNLETISAPTTPQGPSSGIVNRSYTYSVGGSSSNMGHSIQYFFDWGDGTDSEWLPVGTTSASKSWATGGIYSVMVQARCASHTPVVSPWSQTLSVTVIAFSVVSPNGGGTLTAGTIQTIRWSYTGDPGYYVKIELLKAGSVVSTISYLSSMGSGGNGSFNWSIPSTQVSGNDYQIKVSSFSNSSYTDTSDTNFTIVGPPPPTISLVSPNGGETLTAGSTQTIRWSYGGDPGYYVKIELLKAGVAVSTISYFVSIGSGGSGSYNWPIPSTQVSGSDYQIKVTSTSSNSYTDTSDNNFTIVGPPPPTISVTSPNGGETLTAGSTQTIRWSYGGDPGYYVKIELLKAGVAVSTISYFVSIGSGGSGSYNWPIPSTQTSGTDYKIRITSTSNTNYQDTSDNNFTIVGPPPPTISVTSPNGGETLTAGSTQTIRWSYGGDPGYYVKIELLKAGVAVSTISYFVSIGSGGSGSYNWPIPSTQVSGSDYQIKVTSTSSNSYTDTSDNNFTIVGPPPPTISVTSPNGGETLTAGSTQTIRWSYGGDPGYYVKIELLKAGVAVSTISYFSSIGSGGNGSYNWSIPSTQVSGSDYQIKVTSTSNSSCTDTSDNYFTIVGPPPPTISVTSPNGGETLTAGSTQTIRWSYGGDPGYYVKIELLKAGVAVSTISYFSLIGSGGSGSYNWSIPSTQVSGSDYQIKVTSTSSNSYTDTSDNNFTIVGPPPPTISLVSPNGGETLTAGSTQTIRWSYGGDPGYYVKIELLKAGVAVSTISYFSWIGSGGSGSYNWSIPSTQVSGSDYQIRVTSTSNSSYSDTSDSNFTISK